MTTVVTSPCRLLLEDGFFLLQEDGASRLLLETCPGITIIQGLPTYKRGVATTGKSRVFLIPGQAGPQHKPQYEGCMKADTITYPVGDVSPIFATPTYGSEWQEVGVLRGKKDLVSVSLTGHYVADIESAMLRWKCPGDLQVHFGQCADPTAFGTFTKALVIEGCKPISWSTDDLGALSADERNAVNETVDLNGYKVYEILPLVLEDWGSSATWTEVLAIATFTRRCAEPHFFAVTASPLGPVPGPLRDILCSLDGRVWSYNNITSLGGADLTGVGALSGYVIATATNGFHYAIRSEVEDITIDETWYNVGLPRGANAICVSGETAWIAGDRGYVYVVEVPPAYRILQAGSITPENLNDIYAIGSEFAVVVGDIGTVLYTTNQGTWQLAPAPTGFDLSSVWAKSVSEWLVGSVGGELWHTLDKGQNWTNIISVGTDITDIQFATTSVGYFVSDKYLYRTYNGGYSWIVLPEGTGFLPANTRLNAIACPDPNYVCAVGLGIGTDGIILMADAR